MHINDVLYTYVYLLTMKIGLRMYVAALAGFTNQAFLLGCGESLTMRLSIGPDAATPKAIDSHTTIVNGLKFSDTQVEIWVEIYRRSKVVFRT